MNKKKTQSHLEPSWTGPHVGSPRVMRFLHGADTKKSPIESNFTDNINWRIFRIMAEFVEGFEFLASIPKSVTFFGSTRISSTHPFYEIARSLGGLCAQNGFTVITGGGPGIMEAANRGASEVGGESIGLDISLPLEQRRNSFVKKGIGFHYFFTRKVMLSASAQAYVFFPGGFGTLDELFEMLALIQTGKMSDAVPVILVGKVFWHPMMQWIERVLDQEYAFIDHADCRLFKIVDTAEEAFKIIKKSKTRTL